ncbi:SH3 domain-containing protein [Staphylococcus succinus]|uniref:SH3 domain-containing protein n=1 Tax=Staphylococcus succinus TaxID=61015 RepID=UPI00062B44D2|nr:SH3 domain-containing protein [Staphylococcus succinus]PNZ17391.1 CHAP domain-containing protein [Staphylococcus succinus subsp. succinus]
MTIIKNKNQSVKYLKSLEGQYLDYDGWYGAQCFDLANYYWAYISNCSLKGDSAKDIPFENNFDGLATVYENTIDFKAQEGDIVVFNENYGAGHGHVAVVLNGNYDGNYMQFVSLDNNWQGGGWTSGPEQGGKGWETATRVVHNYDFPMWFIRPLYKGAKPNKPSKQKPKKLIYNRDKIARASILGKRGYKPKGIVLHNDAGSGTAMNYHDQLVNASEQRLEAGIAHSYISGNRVWQALPESYIAWHTANAYGNRNYYGIEICQSMSASDKDFLANEQVAFQEAARLLKKWKLPVNSETVVLHNQLSSTQCPHRSMELHAGYSSSQMAPDSVKKKTKDYFISQIKAYYDGEIPKGSTDKGSSKPSSNGSTNATNTDWKQNQYGTWYKAESATFTNGNQPIITRIDAPFTTATFGYNFQPGGYVNYDEVCLQDGYVWIGYNWNGYRYYLPIRTYNGANPPNHKVGDLWGSIS